MCLWPCATFLGPSGLSYGPTLYQQGVFFRWGNDFKCAIIIGKSHHSAGFVPLLLLFVIALALFKKRILLGGAASASSERSVFWVPILAIFPCKVFICAYYDPYDAEFTEVACHPAGNDVSKDWFRVWG